MKYNFYSYLFFIGVVTFLLTSCREDGDYQKLGNEGTTFVKILEAPTKKLFFSPFSDVKLVDLFSIRKDAPTPSELNVPLTVTLTLAPDKIDDYNTENGTYFEVLPDSLYTLVDYIKKSGDVYTIDFAPGDFAKEFSINLNGAKWDLTRTYALAFTLTDAGGKTIPEGMNTIIALISIKNKWDGVYEINGSYSDLTNPASIGLYPYEWELQTTGANQCVVVDNYYLGGAPGFVFDVGDGSGSLSYYGDFGLLVNFDPATDEITSVVNYYGQPASSNTRSAELDPTGENKYDAATKTIKIKYFMKQPSVVPAPPNIRCTFDEEWKFLHDR